MRPFDFYSPTSLQEAVDLLNGQAHIIAGGSDLLIRMKKGELTPATIINIKRLPELKGISFDEKTGLQLGALTTVGQLNRSPLIHQHYPCLAKTAGLIASRQIRNFATVGGNLCNASPSADTAPPLIAFGATVHLVGPAGERDLPLEDFFLGPGQNALAQGELLQRIDIPPPDGHTYYTKHVPRAFMDISVVGVCVRLKVAGKKCQMARIVLGAVGPTAIRARQAEAVLINHTLTPDLAYQAAKLAAEESRPIDDTGGSAWYRRRMVEVGTRRGLQRIMEWN